MVVGADRITDHQWIPADTFYLGRNGMFHGHPVDHNLVRDLLGGREDGEAWMISLKSSTDSTGSSA